MTKIRQTAVIKDFLEHAGLTELEFFASIGRHEGYKYLVTYVNGLIDYEKSEFFRESTVEKEELAAKLAFARGKIAGLREMMYIIEGSNEELTQRLKDNKELS